jgi:hypothetical protein
MLHRTLHHSPRLSVVLPAQPQALPKRRIAEQGGDALGGSALGARSAVTHVGHSDSPGDGSLVRDVLFERSPYMYVAC